MKMIAAGESVQAWVAQKQICIVYFGFWLVLSSLFTDTLTCAG